MAMQRSRRTNPYPFAWEIPLAIVVGILCLFVLGIQTGRSVANLAAGNGWVFVGSEALFTSLPGVLRGDATAGLSSLTSPATQAQLWTSIAIVQFLVLFACAALAVAVWRRWGPTRLHGMATTAEAEQLLGLARLRRHARVIRPDLHSRPLAAPSVQTQGSES